MAGQRINILISCDAVTGALLSGAAGRVNYLDRGHNKTRDK